MVIRCITSLQTQGRLGEVIVVDDASDEETQSALKSLDNVRIYRNVGDEGFVKSVRRGVSKSTNPYVLILNSDTEVFPKALEYMATNLDDGAAVCGALLLYPQNHPHPRLKGRVQHAGVYIEEDGFPTHFMAQAHPDNKAVRTWRSINIVSGAALMTKREIWDRVGGFDLKFGNGVFEDCDYCLSVRKLRQEVIYEPKAVMYHYEHASQSQSDSWFSQQNLQNNLAYLFLKHGQPKSDIDLFCKVR
jgi:GT2 family glycosyltransferase